MRDRGLCLNFRDCPGCFGTVGNYAKSVRRRDGKVKWWSTVMASPDILLAVESSWINHAQESWKIQSSLHPQQSTADHSPGTGSLSAS